MPPIVASNYILANKFKNDEHDEETMEEDEEVVCTLESKEGMSVGNQLTQNKDEEDGDGMIDIEEEIDLEPRTGITDRSQQGKLLEEGRFTKELEGDLERIAKPGYAQAQDPLRKINLGDEEEDLSTFISQLLDK
ncbi:hypothetical protein Adt_14575 [Abeliophyllum distichum]|uniref:Uncharacterized protein n=1 Tax=Abeliophyllum distichum TaxID=126358 RepID=A0ABD1U0S1_9LAMI